MKTIIETKGNKITFKCEPNDELVVKCGAEQKVMKRCDAIAYFFDAICLGDNLEVEQGAYGFVDTLAGKAFVETEL